MNKCNQNIAKISMGCRIIEQSKSSPECSAIHIISERDSNYEVQSSWRSSLSLEPYCIIDFSEVGQKPNYFDTIAFYHSSCRTACASVIEVCRKQKMSGKWVGLGVFSLQRVAGWQSFSFKAVPQNQINFLSLHLSGNFDDGRDVSLTKFALGFQKQSQVQQLRREMAEMRLQNQMMKERLCIQERECAALKDFMLKMEKQVKFILSSTESQCSDDFARLNDSTEDKDPLSTHEQAREIVHQEFDLLQ